MPAPRPVRLGAASISAALAALALAGCSQTEPALDNPNPRQDSRTVTPPTVLRTPAQVSEAPVTVPLPGPSNAPGDTTDEPE